VLDGTAAVSAGASTEPAPDGSGETTAEQQHAQPDAPADPSKQDDVQLQNQDAQPLQQQQQRLPHAKLRLFLGHVPADFAHCR
jgi:hypothetical protein